ncbi:DUF1905 domain-containing protein [Actinospongicola halichondriae]|uniref:DUF1905 domain-containing protein n=1 Tax=Actinospongicola halichondriae TaxID=3236844 RepID=UPI003D46C124
MRVTVGATTWATSVFPDSKRSAYILPMKKAVRKAEGIDDGDTVSIGLELVDVCPPADISCAHDRRLRDTDVDA